MKYQAILFAMDGEYVKDFPRNTKQEVWDAIADMGSRWIFYPFIAVATDKTIVDGYGETSVLIHKNIKQASEYVKKHAEIKTYHTSHAFPVIN